MTLKEKLSLFRQVLADQENFDTILYEKLSLAEQIDKLTQENEKLSIINGSLNEENEKLLTANANLSVVAGDDGMLKGKLIKPSKMVVAKYSLYINRDRTHVGAFNKKDILFFKKVPYNPQSFEVGYVLQGLFDSNLCGLLNEYGEKFEYFIDQKNNQYTSNILIYDYMTLPQVLSLMDLPIKLSENGVTLDMINNAVKFVDVRADELFNKKCPKKRFLSKTRI